MILINKKPSNLVDTKKKNLVNCFERALNKNLLTH